MGLAGAKIHQVSSLGAQLGGLSSHSHGCGNLNAANSIGKDLRRGRNCHDASYLYRFPENRKVKPREMVSQLWAMRPRRRLSTFGRHQTCYVPAKAENFFQHPRTDKRIASGRLQKNRLDLRSQAPVHQRHLELVFVIGDGPDAAQHSRCPLPACKLDHKTVKRSHRHIAKRTGGFFEHLDTLCHGEERIFAGIVEHGDRQVPKELGSTLNQVNVPIGRRVKRAGIECLYGH